MARVWEKIQSHKLEQVKEMVRPMGRDTATRTLLRTQAEEIIREVDEMKA